MIRAVVEVDAGGEGEIAARFVSLFDELCAVAERFFLSRTVLFVAASSLFCLSEVRNITVLATENNQC